MSKSPGFLDLLQAADSAIAFLGPDNSGSSFGQLRATVTDAVSQLNRLKQTPETRPVIATLLPDHPTTALALLAICETATAAPINPALTAQEIDAALARSNAVALLAPQDDTRAQEIALKCGLVFLSLQPQPQTHLAAFSLAASNATPLPGRQSDTAMILATSGSTSAPKAVPLSVGMLRHSTTAIVQTLALTAQDRVVHVLPMFHIGALVDLLLVPLSAGGSICFAHPVSATGVITAITTHQASWFQAVPTMLGRLMIDDPSGMAKACKTLRFIRSVSSDLAPALQTEIEAQLNVPVVQMYGMTETAGQIASNGPQPQARKPGSVGRPAGAEICILDRQGNPTPQGTAGEVCVRGPGVMAGYLATQRSDCFFADYFRTGDQGYLDAQGYLFLTGRLKEMINRGGEKIAPLEIEQCLLSHPDVQDAAVFAVPHPSLGEEPAAAVVLTADNATDPQVLRRWLGQHLADYKVPRQVTLQQALPKLGSGKIDKQSLRLEASADTSKAESDRPTEVAPMSPLARSVARIWAKTLSAPEPKPSDDFFDAGGDSLAATTFVIELEKAAGTPLPANLLFENPTFGALCAALDGLTPATTRRREHKAITAARHASMHWEGRRANDHALFVGRNLTGQKTPIFFASGGPDTISGFISGLDGNRPVYLCRTLSRLRGRFHRSLKNNANNDRLAQVLAEEILQLQPEGPVHLGGFCQGATLMRLVADKLVLAGRDIGLFILADRFFEDVLPYPVLIGWTQKSPFSGFGIFADATPWLDVLYPYGSVVEILQGPHAAILATAEGRRFAEVAEHTIANPSIPPKHQTKEDAAQKIKARRQLHRAGVKFQAPRRMAAGQTAQVLVEVTNASDQPWAPTEESGLRLQARWMNLDGHIRVSRAASAELPGRLDPGQTVRIQMSVQFPDKRIPLLLIVDMVDDGLSWFHKSGGRAGWRVVLPK